jgi:protein-S-isoprenylcysteine O-methyltransferase Ste14
MESSADRPGVAVLPPLLYGGVFLVVLVLRWIWPLRIFENSAAFWPGIGLCVLAVALAMWGRRKMKAAGTNVNPMRPATAIVTTGPFRFTRNPLYLGMTLLFLGLTLAINTWWGVVALVPVLLVMHRGVILREERYLDQKFGDSYRSYRASVRRYF